MFGKARRRASKKARGTWEIVKLKASLVSIGFLLAGGLVVYFHKLLGADSSDLLLGVGIAAVTTGLGGLAYELWLRESARQDAYEVDGLSETAIDAGSLE